MTEQFSRDLALYRTLVTIRDVDLRVQRGLAAEDFFSLHYSTIGQECISATIAETLDAADFLVTTYRGIADLVARGVRLPALFSEIMGRGNGLSKGKGGPMHLAAPDIGVLATTGVVGSGLPIAVGLALAAAYRGDQRITCVTFGDGATSTGSFHEAMGLAALWQLPVVFVCLNNEYALHTHLSSYAPEPALVAKAASYRMPGIQVDGNSIADLRSALGQASATARGGGGPVFVVCDFLRRTGHAFGSREDYMPEERRAQAEAEDPVSRLRQRLFDTAPQLVADLEKRVTAAVAEAYALALHAAPPAASELLTDVLA